MFHINRNLNRLQRLERATFSESGFREREHLQEWIAAMPDALGGALGTELLVIQKEFDGFDGTRERLDLLALNTEGQLVVIENKLDDSGRDVVWQALKYAAYCSSMTKEEIVEVFQRYLDRCGGGNATEAICRFLGTDSIEETVLNIGNSQNIVFIAAKFRREVTSTVLWLLEHGIEAYCIKAIPYRFGGDSFLDLQRVIPTPEAADYMISMVRKETAEKSARSVQQQSHRTRLAFWERTLGTLRERGLNTFDNVTPNTQNYAIAATGISMCGYNLVFAKNEARVEIYMQRPIELENKWLFDQLLKNREDLEKKFGATLQWDRMDGRKACKIAFSKQFESFNEENWPAIIDWMYQHMARLENTFSDKLSSLGGRLKAGEANAFTSNASAVDLTSDPLDREVRPSPNAPKNP